MSIREKIEKRLSQLGIDEVGVIDYSSVRVINPRLSARMNIEPKTAIVFLVPYYAGECDNLSVYAASVDYHIVIERITREIITLIEEEYPGQRALGFGDHSPIDERHAALSLGLGALGDNGLVISPKYGSYVFVADILTTLSPEVLKTDTPLKEVQRCEGCGRCRASCPTGILRGESDTCLSAVTQRKGELSPSEIALMKEYNTAWGCDICSRVCPHNSAPVLTPIPDFYENRITHLDEKAIKEMSEEEFSRRAFSWRGREVLLRNLRHLYGEDN